MAPRIKAGTEAEAPEDAVSRISTYLAKKFPQQSPAEALAGLPYAERMQWLDTLSEPEQAALEYTWEFWARPNQREPKHDYKVLILLAGRGYGKMAPLSEPVPTPGGWSNIGRLNIGDIVFDESGNYTRVTGLYPQGVKKIYRVTFSDGTYSDCGEEHLWTTWTHAARKAFLRSKYEHDISRFPANWPAWRPKRAIDTQVTTLYAREHGIVYSDAYKALGKDYIYTALEGPGPRTVTTKDLMETLTYGKRGDLNHCIPVCAPLKGKDLELPLDPYLLGYWLGDGSSDGAGVTCGEEDRNWVMDCYRAFNPIWKPGRPGVGLVHVPGLRDILRSMNLYNNKHIPQTMLRMSYTQRLALLQGLMDSDGHANLAGSSTEFVNTNHNIADGFEELARTLGQKPVCADGPSYLYGVRKKDKTRITFKPTLDIFRLPRKRDRVRFDCSQALRNCHRMITDIKEIGEDEAQCIAVDSHNALYLTGEGMIPTHNTRTSAEIVRGWVESGKCKHIALVGANAADVRDTMVEAVFKQGSGLMQICPPWNKPHYSPTKKVLVWNNPNYPSYGAVCSLYSAEEPDGLRGPSHDGAWIDELCLVAGTLIATVGGSIPIECVKVGTRVWTRHGLQPVTMVSRSSPREVYKLQLSNGVTLTGTGNHPIWIENKNSFVPLKDVRLNDTIYEWSQLNQALYGMANAGGLMADTAVIGEGSYCTGKYTKPPTAVSQRAWRYITRIGTNLIMRSPISKHLQKKNTAQSTVLSVKDLQIGISNSAAQPVRENGKIGLEVSLENASVDIATSSLSQPHITTKFSFVPRNAHQLREDEEVKIKSISNASIAVRHSEAQNTTIENFVCGTADINSEKSSRKEGVLRGSIRKLALSAVKSLIALIKTGRSHAQRNADMCYGVRVTGIEKLRIVQPVYNIEVASCPEYFANGILTHNCKMKYMEACWDMLKLTLRRGDSPKIVISTTPKPVTLLIDLVKQAQESKEDGTNDVVVIKGSTYENRANLSSSFITDINQMYEGTDLGRQEIYADLVLGSAGALWDMGMIDAARLRANRDGIIQLPTLDRTIVAVDPQTGYKIDTEKSKTANGKTMTGIVVVGSSMRVRGQPQHAYILADRSMNGKPEEWGKAAIDAYKLHDASMIVAEANQGGQMIASVLRSIDPKVRVHLVTATKKKHERAIPVVAKYQQGRVHHCGVFGDLEFEMVNYEPGDEENKKSPNRMDACLIAGTRITTSKGYVPIESVKVGDLVLTRKGWKPVLRSELTNRNADLYTAVFSDGNTLTGTGNHPVFVNNKFTAMDTLVYGDIIHSLWQEKQSSSLGYYIPVIQKAQTGVGDSTIEQPLCSIEISGRLPMGQSQKDAISIILTRIRSTMNYQILNASRKVSTWLGMLRSTGRHVRIMLTEYGIRQLHGISRKLGDAFTRGLERNLGLVESRMLPLPAQSAVKWSQGFSSEKAWMGKAFAVGNVSSVITGKNTDMMSEFRARSAGQSSGSENTKKNLTHAAVSVVGLYKSGKGAVYNLEIADCHEYFANEVLVHNCVWGVRYLLVDGMRAGAGISITRRI